MLLLDRARQGQKLVSLPTITTPGQLIDRLFAHEPDDAPPLIEHLCWARALQQVSPAVSEALSGRRLHDQSFSILLDYAAVLSRTAQLLAGDDILVQEVPDRVESAPASARADALAATFSPDQWRAFATIQELALAFLNAQATSQRSFRALRRLHHVRTSSPATKRPVLLIGAIELPALVRRALTHHALHTTALIAAPATLSNRFTALGTLEPATTWPATLPITDDLLTFASSPLDQAEAALAHIAASSDVLLRASQPPLTPADVVIAVPDLEVAAALQGLASEIQSTPQVRVRLADPVPLARTAPASLLLVCLHFTQDRTLSNLILLLQHPDAASTVNALLDAASRSCWATTLDEYGSISPDRDLDAAQQETWPGASARDSDTLKHLLSAVESWLSPLTQVNHEHSAPILCSALRHTLAQAYQGRFANRASSGALSDVAALKSLNQMLLGIAQLPTHFNLTAADARTLLFNLIKDATIAPEPDGQAIELLGWLDALSDPAPHLILTGLNDQRIPGTPSIDPLLPESLRTLLGVSTSRDRCVRDGYLLDVALHSRRTHLICGRRSQKGDPLLPSRLLLQDDATLPQRILSLQSPAPLGITLTRRAAASATDHFAIRPIDAHAALPTAMSVTSFAAYLRSPYGYYLRHVIRAKDITAPMPELSRLTFGSLMHEALHIWAHSSAAHSSDQREIFLALLDGLHHASRRLVGLGRRVEVELQILIAKERLEHFSHWQAARRASGWEVIYTEWQAPAHSASLEIPGQSPMLLTGRIDRIEINRTGPTPQYAILDYKTGDTARAPDHPHMRGQHLTDFTPYHDLCADGTLASPPPWKDLQLPLYRHLAASIIPSDAPLALGLLHLPRNPREIGIKEFLTNADVLTSADAAARWVVRCIRARHFDDSGECPPLDPTSALLSGVGLFSTRAAAAKSSADRGGAE
jgi:hypothetical protein